MHHQNQSSSPQALALPHLTPHFYASSIREILPLLGSHEHQDADYRSAVELLNGRLGLGLSPHEEIACGYMLTALSRAHRFKMDLFLEPGLGEHSAVHTVHSVIMVQDMFRRAKLLENEDASDEVNQLRRDLSISVLLHDMGEVLGEFSSLGQRVAKTSLSEIPEVEARVFKSAMHLALLAVQERDPSIFYSNISQLRRLADIPGFASGSVAPAHVLQLLDQLSFQVLSRFDLGAKFASSLQKFCNFYDIAELKPSATEASELFIGNATKIVEHIQGSRHFMRFATREPNFSRTRIYSTPTLPSTLDGSGSTIVKKTCFSLPVSLAPSASILGSIKYLDSSVFEVGQFARTEVEKRLARALRDAIYETISEYLSGVPEYVDLTVKSLPNGLMDDFQRAQDPDRSLKERIKSRGIVEARLKTEVARLRAVWEEQTAGGIDQGKLYPVEKVGRLLHCYLGAIQHNVFPAVSGPLLRYQEDIPHPLLPLAELDLSRFHRGALSFS